MNTFFYSVTKIDKTIQYKRRKNLKMATKDKKRWSNNLRSFLINATQKEEEPLRRVRTGCIHNYKNFYNVYNGMIAHQINGP